MTNQEAIEMLTYYVENGDDLYTGYKAQHDALEIALESIVNLDILIDYIVEYDNQDIICDDLYGYDEVDEDSWCSRNCKNFNRECVLKWLEWKRGVLND